MEGKTMKTPLVSSFTRLPLQDPFQFFFFFFFFFFEPSDSASFAQRFSNRSTLALRVFDFCRSSDFALGLASKETRRESDGLNTHTQNGEIHKRLNSSLNPNKHETHQNAKTRPFGFPPRLDSRGRSNPQGNEDEELYTGTPKGMLFGCFLLQKNNQKAFLWVS